MTASDEPPAGSTRPAVTVPPPGGTPNPTPAPTASRPARLARLAKPARWPRPGWRAAVALVAGAGLYLAFPPVGWWPLAPLAVAAFTATITTRAGATATTGPTGKNTPTGGLRLRRSYGLGVIFGLAFLLPMLYFTAFVGLDAWLALSIAEAFLFALLAPATTLASRLRGRGRHPITRALAALWPLGVGAAWVAQEALRGRAPFGGFPWGRLAFSQADGPYTALAALGGAPLVTMAVASSGALLAATATATAAATRRPAPAPGLAAATPSPRPRARPVWTAVPVLLALAIPGLSLLIPTPTGAQDGTLTVAAIQGNVPEHGGLDALGRATQVTTNHLAETQRLAAAVAAGRAPQPDLVLWPENSSDLDPFNDPATANLLDAAARAAGAPLLVGAVLDGPGAGHVRNAGLLWTPDGYGDQMYVKRHPVPFAEYLPGRAVLQKLITRFATDMPNDFVHGKKVGLLHLGGVPVGDVICFEVAYDGIVRSTVTAGARLVVVQTNNASFGRKGESQQQLAMTRLRAVEHGRTTIQVSTSGQSAIVAPDGRILTSSGLYEPAALTSTVPLRSSLTLADRLGLIPEILLVGWGVAATAAGITAGRRREPAGGDRPTRDNQPPRPRPEGSEQVQAARVLVCVPTYNERENLPTTLNRLRTANPDADVLVIDDSSPDGTGDLADTLAATDPGIHVLHRASKAGLGTAYVEGFRWGLDRGYTVLVEMDADGSHQPEQLPRLLAALEGADLVIGSRWVDGGAVRNWPRSRLILSRGANTYVRLALGMPLRDATAGYRAYRAELLRARDLGTISSQGYCFQVDLTWRAWRAGWRITEVPITFVERERGASKMSRSIVAEALWRVTWWAVTSRRHPATNPTGGGEPPTHTSPGTDSGHTATSDTTGATANQAGTPANAGNTVGV